MSEAIPTGKKYSLIYADPPWRQSKGGKKQSRPNSSGGNLDYPVISLDEIKTHLSMVPTTENCIIFCGQ